MPPVAAAATALITGVGAAVAVAPLTAAALGVGTYSIVTGAKQAEAARSQLKKQAESVATQKAQELEFMEKQAGEYYQLTSKQMELQTQASNITTLANLIEQTSQPPIRQIITLPPAEEYSAVEQINQAIGRLFRG